jgi:type II secretory pathway component PulJ
MLWDLLQQSQLSQQNAGIGKLEARVENLERQLSIMNQLLREIVSRMEHQTGEDINRDGKIG